MFYRGEAGVSGVRNGALVLSYKITSHIATTYSLSSETLAMLGL